MSRKTGPTPKPDEEKRTHRVGFRLTDEELGKAEARAKATRLRLGAWFREAALGREPRIVPEINRKAWEKLARLAGNLNQLIAAAHAGKVVKIKPAELEELRSQVMTLRLELRGGEGEDEPQESQVKRKGWLPWF